MTNTKRIATLCRETEIAQVSDAYEIAACRLGIYNQLTPAIKLHMCGLLDWSPKKLESWIVTTTDEEFEKAIF